MNPCVNCGKERINGKTWKGKTGTFVVTYTQTMCPDKECQKVVDKVNADRKEKSENLLRNKAKMKEQKAQMLASEKELAAGKATITA